MFIFREWFVAALLGGIYLCALPTFTYGGRDLVAMLQVNIIVLLIVGIIITIFIIVTIIIITIITMLQMFGSGTPILFVVFIEVVGVFWFYGVSRSKPSLSSVASKP